MKIIFKLLKQIINFNREIRALTVVSVGPGDSSLLTMAALKAIKKSNVVFYPIASEDKKSVSAEIVKKYIKYKKQIPIVFPMSRKGFNPNEIWLEAAEKISSYIKNKKSVVLLCLGDASLFASSSYILKRIKVLYPEIPINILPGITSFSLAAALSNFDLVNKGEILKVFECPNNSSQLRDLIKRKGEDKIVFVILKVGKRWNWVKDVLSSESLLDNALLAVNVGMNNQFIGNALEHKFAKLPYFSLLLIRF